MATTADYVAFARAQAQADGVDPDVFERQIQQESGFNPSALSPAGAIGIAQIMPGTAAGWGVDPTDPYASLAAAAKAMGSYLARYGGSYADALAAYDAGPGAVDQYGGVPPYPETQAYVNAILGGSAPLDISREIPWGPLAVGAAALYFILEAL